MRKLVPFNEGCAQLKFHPQHVRRLIKAGILKPPVPLYEGGHHTFYTQEYLDEVIATAVAPLHAEEAEVK